MFGCDPARAGGSLVYCKALLRFGNSLFILDPFRRARATLRVAAKSGYSLIPRGRPLGRPLGHARGGYDPQVRSKPPCNVINYRSTGGTRTDAA